MSDAPEVHLTRDVPGIGGTLRTVPEDFIVAERLKRTPSGSGTFAWVHVEKTGIATPRLVRELGSMLGIRAHEIHPAGFKDAHAVARQWISIPARASARLTDSATFRILEVARDHESLSAEHIASNHFTITIRDCDDSEVGRGLARTILDRLVRRGLPNRFGAQRFGVRGESAHVGAALLRRADVEALDWILGHPSPKEGDPRARVFREAYQADDFATALRSCPGNLRLENRLLERLAAGASKSTVASEIPRQERRFYTSALQSELFNRVLERRLIELHDDFRTLFTGDLAIDESSGSSREIHDPAAAQAALDAFQISPTAPMFGARCPLATGRPGDIEREVLASAGFDRDDFKSIRDLTLDGMRRSLRVRIRELELEFLGEQRAVLRFALPSGAFATALLSEFMKTPNVG